MSFLGSTHHHKHESEVINITINNYECCPEKSHPVRLILKQIINQSTYQIMALSLASNQKSLGTLGLQDTVTGAAVTSSFTNVAPTSDNTSVYTAATDADGNVIVSGVTPGTGTLVVTAVAAYTDSTGAAQSAPLTVSVGITVTQVVVADQVALTISFGNPTAQ